MDSVNGTLSKIISLSHTCALCSTGGGLTLKCATSVGTCLFHLRTASHKLLPAYSRGQAEAAIGQISLQSRGCLLPVFHSRVRVSLNGAFLASDRHVFYGSTIRPGLPMVKIQSEIQHVASYTSDYKNKCNSIRDSKCHHYLMNESIFRANLTMLF